MNVHIAAAIIRKGGVIAYPTEAVWGFGCDPWNSTAVNRTLNLKARPVHKGLILVGCSESQFEPILTPLADKHRAKLSICWPGPYTWLIPDLYNWVPHWIKGSFDSVAIRVSAHPLIKNLCQEVGGPIVSTSANRSGQPPKRTFLQVKKDFSDSLDGILIGTTEGLHEPSEIRDLLSGRVIRSS